MSNFIMIITESGYEILINLDNVSQIQKGNNYAVISFCGDSLDRILISIETYEQLKAKLV